MIINNRARYFFGLFAASCLFGCETLESGSKEDLGTAIGAALGAVIAAASEDDDKGKAALIGGALGALLGNRIGHHLDEQDRKELEATTRHVLESTQVGQTTTWTSSRTKASAELTPIREVSKPQEFKTEMHSASGLIYTSTHLNLRTGPGTAFRSKEVLPPNSRLELKGITENGWYKVSKHSGEEGYVAAKYASESQVAVARTSNEGRAGSGVTTYEISAKPVVTCKTVLVRTKIDGQVVEDTVETCQDANGSWGA